MFCFLQLVLSAVEIISDIYSHSLWKSSSFDRSLIVIPSFFPSQYHSISASSRPQRCSFFRCQMMLTSSRGSRHPARFEANLVTVVVLWDSRLMSLDVNDFFWTDTSPFSSGNISVIVGDFMLNHAIKACKITVCGVWIHLNRYMRDIRQLLNCLLHCRRCALLQQSFLLHTL